MIYQFLFYTTPHILEGGNPNVEVRQGKGGGGGWMGDYRAMVLNIKKEKPYP